MSKAAEKLLILREAGEALLHRVASAKRIISSPTQRPAFLSDPQFSKVTQALLKKFPEFEPNIEKTPGYDVLTQKAKVLYDEVEPLYYAFIDAYEFKEAAVQTLSEIASSIVEMKMDDNPFVTVNYLDLFTVTAQLNFLISSIEERKLILAVYYKLFFFIKCTNEPNFGRVSNYAVALDNPIKAMQDDFRPLNTSLGKTLVNLMPVYSKIKTVVLLRKEGTLSVTLKPEDMSKPITDKFHYELIHSNNITLWITFGFLLCPETLALPGAIDLLKMVLSDAYVTPVFRATTIQLHGEYDNLFDKYKSNNKALNLSKHKKMIKDVVTEAVLKGHISHRQRRIYLRQELSNLVNIFADKPGLLGPKFQLALCALSMAKEEVFWYFRHIKAQAPKLYGKKINEDEIRDNKISELLYLIDKLSILIRNNKRIIQQYYLEYLKGADRKKLSEVCDAGFMASVGNGISQIVKSIIDELGAINVDQALRGKADFKALRLNWYRAEASLSSVQSSIPLMKVKNAVDRLSLIAQHTRFVDEIDNLMDQYASLKQLWYFKETLFEIFTRSIKDGPNQPLHCVAFLNLLAEFPSNSTAYNPEERPEIGQQVVSSAEKYIDEITGRIIALVNEVIKQNLIFDSGLAEVNAAYPLLMKRKDYKLPKDFQPPAQPGTESAYRVRPQYDRLRLYQRNAWQLCAALNEVETVTIYDNVFAPREFLREKLMENFRTFLRSASAIEVYDDKHKLIDKSIQRPSVVEKQVETYMSVIKTTESFVDLDIGEMFRDVLISEVWIPALGRSGTFDFVNAEETDIKFNNSMVGSFVSWYADFISKKVSVPQNGIVYSVARKGFVSKTGSAIKAELFTDFVELKSLCNLIGPYGVKLIDREILKFVLSSVNTMKDYVSHNRQALDEIRLNYYNETICNESLKKIKDADNFITRCIAIGNALQFRDNLHEALRYVVEEKTPFIFNTINTSFNEYRRNTFMSPELLSIDALAMESGLDLGNGTADQALKKFLNKSIGSADAPLWDLLPYMYAASVHSATLKESMFNPIVEGHNNNAHTLAKAINNLIIAFKSITISNPDEKEIIILLQKCIEVKSVLLLRLTRGSQKQEKHAPADVPSMIVFMDKFIQECPLLTREALEGVMPYALLRNQWKSIYSSKAIPVGKKEVTAE